MNADGSHRRRVATAPPNVAITHAWAPDGRHLAYKFASGNGRRVFLANADGSHGVEIAQETGYPNSLDWSPDARHLVADTTLVDIRTNNQTQLPGTAAWSPDGSRLAAVDGDGFDLISADGMTLAHLPVCTP